MKEAEIVGLDSWEDWFSGVANNLEREVSKEVDKAGSNIHRSARFNVPVDTGDLRKSITKELDNSLTGIFTDVFSGLHYAEDVELGNSRQRAQPYLFPALNQEIPKFERQMTNILRSEIGK